MIDDSQNKLMKQQLMPREASMHNQIRSINIAKVQNGFVIYVERYNHDGHYHPQSNQYIANSGSEVLTIVCDLIDEDAAAVK